MVEHSFPLKPDQKKDLATRLTNLHAHAFTTPSIFIQVKFEQQDATKQNHFVGGEVADQSINRIIGYVRSSSSRTQEQFDKLAADIEDAWMIVVGEKIEAIDEEDRKRQEKDKKESSESEKTAKELLSMTFIPGLSGREKGFIIPQAGQEEQWFKSNREQFQKRADAGDTGLKAMIEEVDTREDLKAWRS